MDDSAEGQSETTSYKTSQESRICCCAFPTVYLSFYFFLTLSESTNSRSQYLLRSLAAYFHITNLAIFYAYPKFLHDYSASSCVFRKKRPAGRGRDVRDKIVRGGGRGAAGPPRQNRREAALGRIAGESQQNRGRGQNCGGASSAESPRGRPQQDRRGIATGS